ncbi:MAG TPA: type II secretion system F family protein, partial [Methanocorpusculum sp.]|nr:type II secretion system F family protein [Methanocorpusculum sp.]
FSAKSQSYREIAQDELESSMQFLEIIAEVYVTLFVAGPIALMIMLVAQSLSGTITIGNLMPIMFIGLPIGAIAIISILYFMLPQNNLSISKKEIHGSEFSPDIIGSGNREVNVAFEKKLKLIKSTQKLKRILRHPMMAYSSNYYVPTGCGIFLALLVFLLWNAKVLPSLFHSSSFLLLICLEIIAFMLPIAIAYEIRSRYVTRVERQLPEFLREISDMRDIGMTLQGAIVLIAKSKSGVLSSELRLVSKELDYGSSLSSALVRMENRIGVTNVKRAVSLLVRASEVTDYIREILAIAVGDLNHYLKMKSKRFSAAFAYVAIVYISFGIFLFTAYIILNQFINAFTTMNVTFNLAGSTQDMFIVSVILASFSGIMAGQMSANSPLAGFKHSIIMLVLTIILFIFII